MVGLAACLGRVAPFYNLFLVIIVILLFVRLFHLNPKKVYLKPWKLVFIALLVYVVEQVTAVLEMANIVDVSALLFPLMEMVIITIFIYLLLLQREFVAK